MNTGQMIEIVPTHVLCGTEHSFSCNGKASPPECATQNVLLETQNRCFSRGLVSGKVPAQLPRAFCLRAWNSTS